MLPFVLVWVRQWGAWKLHPYNFIAQNWLLLPSWHNLNKIWRPMNIATNMKHAEIPSNCNTHTITLHMQPHWYSPTSCITTMGELPTLVHPSLQQEHIQLIILPHYTSILLVWTTCFIQFIFLPFLLPTLMTYRLTFSYPSTPPGIYWPF